MNVPEWLIRRGGTLERGTDGKTWFVILNNQQPQYRVTPIPASGKFGCAIVQTNNGKRIPSDCIADNAEAAVEAGLDDLRKYLGWE